MKIRKMLFHCLVFVPYLLIAQTNFVHPGLSHKKSDLDRMKYMVEAGIEPFASSYQLLAAHPRAKFDVEVAGGNTGMTVLTESWNKFLVNDGITAYYNALMWYITGDERHAEKSIEVFSAYSDLTSHELSVPLDSGRHWKLIEAAEIIKSTYSGWASEDIQKFKDMLVYPGYSNTTAPTAALASGNHTLYWHIYQGDPARHGNQGIFGMRMVMAMGVFLDNEIMYDRAVRYLRGEEHRSDDLAYPSGPPNITGVKATYEHFIEYNLSGFSNTEPDYGYNEVISNYIYENGQCQESSRDQAHALGGVATLATIAEIDWTQGGDLYGHLDNRILAGLNFWYRYNLSWVETFDDQPSPWEPTVENGEYIQRSDRSGRWKSLKINPYLAQTTTEDVFHRGRVDLLTAPALEPSLAHYRDRMNLATEDTKWIQRGFDFLTEEIGMEQLTSTDYLGLGGLKARRVSPGDPISGFDSNGLPAYDMNVLPSTIEAENYDYFVLEGQERTYNDLTSSNTGGEYRTDETVDIKVCSEGGYNITSIQNGEWLAYTVNVPSDGTYDIDIRYASLNTNGKIKFNFGGEDITPEVIVPFGGANSTGLADWKDLKVGNSIRLSKGVQAMKIFFSGADNSFELNNISINLIAADVEPTNIALLGTASQSTTDYDGVAEYAIDGNTNGSFGNGSVTHTANVDADRWWQVDLGGNKTITKVVVFNRTGNASVVQRLTDFTVEVIDALGKVTFSQFFAEYPNPLTSIDTGTAGVIGSIVKISKSSESPITLAEVEVYGYQTLSNSETILNNVNIYPNPASNNFKITNSLGSFIQVYDMLGKLMMKKNIKSEDESVDISDLNSGVYIIKIINNGLITSKKVIKK